MDQPKAPPGLMFVGYYCEHRQPLGEDGKPDWSKERTPHRNPFYRMRPKYKAERGWEEGTSTTRALSFPDFRDTDAERNCQYRVPMFARIADIEKASKR